MPTKVTEEGIKISDIEVLHKRKWTSLPDVLEGRNYDPKKVNVEIHEGSDILFIEIPGGLTMHYGTGDWRMVS